MAWRSARIPRSALIVARTHRFAYTDHATTSHPRRQAGRTRVQRNHVQTDDPQYSPELNRAELTEYNAEWIEIYNPTDSPLNLDNCELIDFAENRVQPADPTVLQGVIVAPRDVALFVRSDRPDLNGGLRADHRFFFNLTNAGDTLILTCGGSEVDRVTYVDGAGTRRARVRHPSVSTPALSTRSSTMRMVLGASLTTNTSVTQHIEAPPEWSTHPVNVV